MAMPQCDDTPLFFITNSLFWVPTWAHVNIFLNSGRYSLTSKRYIYKCDSHRFFHPFQEFFSGRPSSCCGHLELKIIFMCESHFSTTTVVVFRRRRPFAPRTAVCFRVSKKKKQRQCSLRRLLLTLVFCFSSWVRLVNKELHGSKTWCLDSFMCP
jgi:hypothetical protein